MNSMVKEMDVKALIEQIETKEEDFILTALETYNKEMALCFEFQKEHEKDRQHLGELVLSVLRKEPSSSSQLICLETIKILTRDKLSLDPFVTHLALSTLAYYAGIFPPTENPSQQVEQQADGETEAQEGADVPWRVYKDGSLKSDQCVQEVVVESLKSICNILLQSEQGLVVAADLQLMKGITKRMEEGCDAKWNHEVRFFDLRLTFLLTAQRIDIREELAQELHGVTLLANQLDATLGLCWPDTFETARGGLEDASEDAPPLSCQQAELSMEILKVLFNITFTSGKNTTDEESAKEFRRLGAILRHCLISRADGEEQTEEFHSHTINLLGNFPLHYLDVLLMTKTQQDSITYMGVNMDAVNMLLEFMDKRLDRCHQLKETVLPSLTLLTESSRIHRETRKYLRSKVLPPLRDVTNRPEVGNTLRNKLVRLMTHIDTDLKDCAAEFLFILCKENVSRFIKYTGYGNAAGLLAARGLFRGSKVSGVYSEDEDSDTEEYKEAKSQINPVTGAVEEEHPDPMEGMTEEQKELEAMKLVSMFDRLSRSNFIQPMKLDVDGNMTEITHEDLRNCAPDPVIPADEPANAGSDEEPL
ncbi:chaperone Ric-8A [Nelusetta ayraudi]|uniref:chaperone Ric-8A n=1 Tax=Nelusetta ayraudi TaxID=303726 RepID=UPI003F7043E3